MKRRKSNNPAGRPVKQGATYLLKLPPALLQSARDSAALQGITLAEWWRNAAWLALGDALNRPDSRLIE